jgi:hypothetical protein
MSTSSKIQGNSLTKSVITKQYGFSIGGLKYDVAGFQRLFTNQNGSIIEPRTFGSGVEWVYACIGT